MKKAILALVLLAGCYKDGVPMVEDNRNPKAKEFNVTLIFEHEGCKVYRFSDDSIHYYANCGYSTSTMSENCYSDGNGGQTCYPVEVSNDRKRK